MQRIPNYGSFMQAWALKRVLEELGAAVWFIEPRAGRQMAGYRQKGVAVYVRWALTLLRAAMRGESGAKWRNRNFYRAMRAQYRDRYYDMLGLNDPSPAHFDLAVIGSDQVFNPFEEHPYGFTTHFFGDVPEASHVISYAASFGWATVDMLRRTGIADDIAANLEKMEGLSVRDDVSRDIVRELTGREALVHLDPTLIYDFTPDLQGRTSGEKDYIAIYAYGGRITSREEVDAIRAFARERGKRLVSLFSYYDWCDESIIPPSPFDVLAWIRDADYVISDTFHGTIFSIVTHSNFCTLVRESNAMRLEPLLRRLGLEGRRATTPQSIEAILAAPPDYAGPDRAIDEERRRSREYLLSKL